MKNNDSNKYMNKNTYPYLREPFNDFIKGVLESSKAVPTLRDAYAGSHAIQLDWRKPSLRKLCQSLGITQEEFGQRFWEPWRQLTPEQAIEVVKYLNMGFIPEQHLLMEITPINAHRALQWTLVNIYKANLFEVFLDDYQAELSKPGEQDLITHAFVAPAYSLPYKQCYYCGRLEKDPREKPFGQGELSFCNLLGCPSSASNPSEHMPGCCYADWQRIKRNIHRRLDAHKKEPQRVVKVFLDFCRDRYQENLKIRIPVQVQKEKPSKWRHLFDRLAVTIHEEGKEPPTNRHILPLFGVIG